MTSTILHQQLVRQLQRLGLDRDAPPDPEIWGRFLDSISRQYHDSDRERFLLENSAEVYSKEMYALNLRGDAERNQFEQIFQGAPVGMARIELDGTVTAANDALAGILGYEPGELSGFNASGLVTEERQEIANSFFTDVRAGKARSTKVVTRLLHKNGSPVNVRLGVTTVQNRAGKPLHLLMVVEDITEQIQLEIKLRHANKLESVGRLASGIAHEINTPIQFVGDNISYLSEVFTELLELCETYHKACERGAGGPLAPEDLEAVREAEETADLEYAASHVPRALASTQDGIRRVATIVQSMKSFAHPDRGEKSTADLNAAMRGTLVVASNELKYVANVEAEYGELPFVPCYLSDMNQVFLNLLVNAAHAIGDVKNGEQKGTIRVKTWVDGEHVVISVSDTGTGIPTAIRDRIFDPFFTTKEVGKGTGQGLALAHSVVVDKHGGALSFESEVGKGTTFFIRLPLLQEARKAASAPVAAASP